MAPKKDPNAPAEGLPGVTTLGAEDISTEEYKPTRQDLRGGITPLMSAAAGAATDSIEAILEHVKAKHTSIYDQYLNAVDVSGMTALAWACHVPNGNSIEAIEILIAAGARDDSMTVDGRALVHVAAGTSRTLFVE